MAKLGIGFFLALGQAIRNLLDCFAGSGLSCKSSGFRVARLMPKAKTSRPSSSPPETTSKVSSGLILVRSPPGGLEVVASVATKARVRRSRFLLWVPLGRSPRHRRLQGRRCLCLPPEVSGATSIRYYQARRQPLKNLLRVWVWCHRVLLGSVILLRQHRSCCFQWLRLLLWVLSPCWSILS